jgi:hypothetical protein
MVCKIRKSLEALLVGHDYDIFIEPGLDDGCQVLTSPSKMLEILTAEMTDDKKKDLRRQVIKRQNFLYVRHSSGLLRRSSGFASSAPTQ